MDLISRLDKQLNALKTQGDDADAASLAGQIRTLRHLQDDVVTVDELTSRQNLQYEIQRKQTLLAELMSTP